MGTLLERMTKNCAFCLEPCSCLQLSLSSESEFHGGYHRDGDQRCTRTEPSITIPCWSPMHNTCRRCRPGPRCVLNHHGSSPIPGRHSDVSAIVLRAIAIHTKRVGSIVGFFGESIFLVKPTSRLVERDCCTEFEPLPFIEIGAQPKGC